VVVLVRTITQLQMLEVSLARALEQHFIKDDMADETKVKIALNVRLGHLGSYLELVNKFLFSI
jgi:hypothetical protein